MKSMLRSGEPEGAGSPLRAEPSSSSKPCLAVVLVQYDREKYRGALERLLAVVDRLSATATVVVVDNRYPKMKTRRVSDQLIHIGGDNSAWEFSAFDKGVRFLDRSGIRPDLYAFVTDAFMAYGDAFLELIDDQAVETALRLGACLGWIDSIMQRFQIEGHAHDCHLRTSFLLMPTEIYAEVGPLNHRFDERAIFSRRPAEPFKPSAPVSDNLREFLLAWLTTNSNTELQLQEGWHSQFELNAQTFPFFRRKTLAILREFSLSARLFAAGVPCYDYRVVKQLQHFRDKTDLQEAAQWQWLGWKGQDMSGDFHIDWVHFEETMTHGENHELEIAGWVRTVPQVSEIRLALAEDRVYRASCNLARSDGLPGFEMKLHLRYLPPGDYRVVWSVPKTPIRRDLGPLKILPRQEFKVSRCCVSDLIYHDMTLPVYLEGEFLSSYRVDEVQLLLNGHRIEIESPIVGEREEASGLRVYHILLNETLVAESLTEQHGLELHFLLENGEREVWSYYTATRIEEGTPHVLSMVELGTYDALSKTTPAFLKGAIYSAETGHRLSLVQNGVTVFERELLAPKASESKGEPVWQEFDLKPELTDLVHGLGRYKLILSGPSRPPEVLKEWSQAVLPEKVEIHVDRFSIEPIAHKKCHYVIHASGWVQGHRLVRGLMIEVDGQSFASFGLEVLRPDLTTDGLVRKQGFYVQRPIQISPGDYTITISAEGPDNVCGTWKRQCRFEEPVPEIFSIFSEHLEQLEEKRTLAAYSSLVLEGRVETKLQEVLARLQVEGETVDEQILRDGERFSLRYTPPDEASFNARLVFKARHRTVYDSGLFSASARKLSLPSTARDHLQAILEEFALEDVVGSDAGADSLLLALAEENIESIGDFLQLLDQCEMAVSRAREREEQDLLAVPPSYEGKRLKILMGCWEVPCLRHGGGVYVANLLRELGDRHDITLVHPYSVDETGWIEDVRPYVEKVVSVPRWYAEKAYKSDLKIPEIYYQNYTAELKKALEAEIHSAEYDLVDYQYTMMYHHMPRCATPSVMTILEMPFTAQLTSLHEDDAFERDGAGAIDRFLKNFHFNTVQLPRVCRHLVTVTEDDATALARYQHGAEVYVNSIGVDMGRFRTSEVLTPKFGAGEPSFTFLGNYRHPPNLKAALFLATEVMPRILRRHPHAKLYILGSHAPPEIKNLAGESVVVKGFVKDFRPYLWQSTAFIAPIFTGSGMRVKILEAMACGCPVISTRLGMNGIGVTDGEHYLAAHTAEEFSAAASRCIEEKALVRSMVEKSRRLMKEQHSWEKKAEEREAIWGAALREARARASGAPSAKTLEPRVMLSK